MSGVTTLLSIAGQLIRSPNSYIHEHAQTSVEIHWLSLLLRAFD